MWKLDCSAADYTPWSLEFFDTGKFFVIIKVKLKCAMDPMMTQIRLQNVNRKPYCFTISRNRLNLTNVRLVHPQVLFFRQADINNKIGHRLESISRAGAGLSQVQQFANSHRKHRWIENSC